jgi:N-acetylmuramoyl-L-alanine amidase
MLIETAFVTDKQDALRLINPAFQEKLAHSILSGVKSYFMNTPPPGTWFAYQAARRMRTADAAQQQASWSGPDARARSILENHAQN